MSARPCRRPRRAPAMSSSRLSRWPDSTQNGPCPAEVAQLVAGQAELLSPICDRAMRQRTRTSKPQTMLTNQQVRRLARGPRELEHELGGTVAAEVFVTLARDVCPAHVGVSASAPEDR